MNEERIKKFFFNVKIFVWYMVTEPFRSIAYLGKKNFKKFTSQSSWLIIYLGFVILFFLTNNNKMKWAFLFLLLIGILRYEWKSGAYVYKWREHYKKRIVDNVINEFPSDEQLVREFEGEGKSDLPKSDDCLQTTENK